MAVMPTLLLRDFTPMNELRYLSIADEALRNHTFFAFTNQGLPYADKPPLYLWLIMFCKAVTGAHHMWLLSLFSLLPALGTVWVMDRWTAREMPEDYRQLGRMMLLTSGIFIGAALMIRMDMLMCFFIVLSLREFWRMMTASGSCGRSCWLFPLYMFLAVFTKGPLGLLIPLCCTTLFLALSGRIREWARYWGWRTWAVLLVLFSVWIGAAYSEGGASYLQNLLVHQTVDRAVNSYHHSEPIYYYGIAVWYCLAPWSLLIGGAFIAALRKRSGLDDIQKFFITVALTTFVLLSLISSKLQIYLLPAVPFFVYSTAMLLPQFSGARWPRLAVAVPAAIFTLALPAMLLVESLAKVSLLNDGALYAAAMILTLCGAMTLYLLYNKHSDERPPLAACRIAVGLLAAVCVGGCAWPRINAVTGYRMLCARAQQVSAENNISEIRTWRLTRSENMDVYLKHDVDIIPEDKTPEPEQGRPYLLITSKDAVGSVPAQKVQLVGRFAISVCP